LLFGTRAVVCSLTLTHSTDSLSCSKNACAFLIIVNNTMILDNIIYDSVYVRCSGFCHDTTVRVRFLWTLIPNTVNKPSLTKVQRHHSLEIRNCCINYEWYENPHTWKLYKFKLSVQSWFQIGVVVKWVCTLNKRKDTRQSCSETETSAKLIMYS
jgi:hypothetical protein